VPRVAADFVIVQFHKSSRHKGKGISGITQVGGWAAHGEAGGAGYGSLAGNGIPDHPPRTRHSINLRLRSRHEKRNVIMDSTQTALEPQTSTGKPAPPASASITGPATVAFDWPLAYDAEQLLRRYIDSFLQRNSFARGLAKRMRDETATDFFEWIDHLALPRSEEEALRLAGFVKDERTATPDGAALYEHPRATLPRVILRGMKTDFPSLIALRPEHLDEFISRHNLRDQVEGEQFSRYRRIAISEENGTRLEAVERLGYRGFVPAQPEPGERDAVLKARELWHNRPRVFANEADGFAEANRILQRVLTLVPVDVACQLFFEA